MAIIPKLAPYRFGAAERRYSSCQGRKPLESKCNKTFFGAPEGRHSEQDTARKQFELADSPTAAAAILGRFD
jgi:hypothetical protein